MVQTPKWRSDRVITETNLVTYHKRKALQRCKGSNSIHVGKKKKKIMNFHIHFPKTSIVILLYTQWEADRYICVDLFKWQSSNLGRWWVGTALGCSFGEGKRHDYAGSCSKSKKSRNNRVCSGSYTRQFAGQSDKHPSWSPSQLVGLSHWRIKLFCHMPVLKISPPSSVAPSALPAPWEHKPLLLQWGKTTKRTKVVFPGLMQVTSLTEQLYWKVICPSLRQIRIRALSRWQPFLRFEYSDIPSPKGPAVVWSVVQVRDSF